MPERLYFVKKSLKK